MSVKTFFRLFLAVVLLAGYYLSPRFLGGGTSATIGFSPQDVVRIEVEGLEEGPLRLRKTRGRWIVEERQGVEGDAAVFSQLLSGLAEADLRPAEHRRSGDEPRLTFSGRWGKLQTVELGPRLEAFRRQVVFLDGEPFEIDFDASAALGLWQGESGWKTARLTDNVLFALQGDEMIRMRVENPFATYDLERTGDEAEERRDDGRILRLYPWRETGSHSEAEPSSSMMQHIAEALELVVAEQPADASELPEKIEPYRQVLIRTESGRELAFEVTSRGSRTDREFVRLTRPARTDWFSIRPFSAERIAPAGAPLFSPRQEFQTGAKRARRIRYQREGVKVELIRDGGGWKMAHPQVPLPIYRPPPDSMTPNPMDMAEEYADRLAVIYSQELFVVDEPEREALIEGAFDHPLGRIEVEGADGRVREILLSHPVGATRRIFVSVEGEVGVLGEESRLSLAPDVQSFFDRKAVANLNIQE